MTKKEYYKKALLATMVLLVVLTPLFVWLDAKRLGYVPLNGAWFTWAIPALLLVEVDHE